MWLNLGLPGASIRPCRLAKNILNFHTAHKNCLESYYDGEF